MYDICVEKCQIIDPETTIVSEEKYLKCFKWILQTPSSYQRTVDSEIFSIKDLRCNLQFYSGVSHNYHAKLNFKSKGRMDTAIEISICVLSQSDTLYSKLADTITSSDQTIWSHDSRSLLNRELSFEVIFRNEPLKADKSMQTPPYMDTRFLLERSSKDFSKLLEDGPDHDVEFSFGDEIIKAHRHILCCRSNVFSSMLQGDMIEGKTGHVNIQDIDANIFHQFLRCIYTGMLPELTVDTAVQLYKTSDKYAVAALKKQCAEYLIDNLSVQNACDFLVLADRHSDPDLKESVVEYIFKEKIPVRGEKWADFCNKNQKLAIEVLNSFCQHICPK